MVSFGRAARGFVTGFVSAANVQFDERRKALAAKDLEATKFMRSTILPAYTTAQVNAAKSATNKAKILATLPFGPGSNLIQAQVAAGTLDPKKAGEFLQRLTPAQRTSLAKDPFEFDPGQTGVADLQTMATQAGMSEEQFLKTAKELNIDLSKFTGQAAIDPSLTGGPEGFTLGDVPPVQTGSAGGSKLATKQLREIRTAVQQWFAGEGIFKFVAGPEGGSFQLDIPVGVN